MGAGGVRALVAAAALTAAAAQGAGDETVLTIYAETRVLPVVITLDQAIRSTLQARSPAPVQMYTEYLDLSWFAGKGPEELIARVMREKYAARNLGVIITCGEAAIRFVGENADRDQIDLRIAQIVRVERHLHRTTRATIHQAAAQQGRGV